MDADGSTGTLQGQNSSECSDVHLCVFLTFFKI